MKKIILILLISLLTFSACDSNSTMTTPKPQSNAQTELNKNKKLWNTETPPHYFFTVRQSCFCPDLKKKLVTIKENKIESVKYIPSNTVLNAQAVKEEKSILGYFDFIQDAINKKAEDIKVTYNTTYGYPERIAIDYNKQMADEEMYYDITHFNKTDRNGDIACTAEYAPVCGRVEIQCVTTPCEAIEETFSNSCNLNANPLATYLKDGEC